MKKYDELLKRVEIFEKLATYGNRKEFLHSLSQLAPNLLDPRPGTEELGARELDELAKSQGRPAPMSYDPNASLIPKYKVPSTIGPPSSATNPKLVDPEQKYWDDKAKGVSAPTVPAAPAKSKGGYTFNSDVFRAQQRLRSSPYTFKDLEVDGYLGPNTRAHLQSYMQQVGKKMSDAEAIKNLANEPYPAPLSAPLSHSGQGEPTMLDPKLQRNI